VSRLASLFLVGLLTVSASGLPELISLEPCVPGVAAAGDDGGCTATCVRCSCCAHPTDLFVAIPSLSGAVIGIYPQTPSLLVPLPESREIFHIPKTVGL
jgi:hypothetical protein